MQLADSLPNRPSAKTIAHQPAACVTAAGANYRAACRARSQAEFVAKLGIVEEEADESGFWIELVMESGLQPESRIAPLHKEADELTRILARSVKTARATIQNQKSKIQNRSNRRTGST